MRADEVLVADQTLQRFCQKCGCDSLRLRKRWWGRRAWSVAHEPPLRLRPCRCNRLQPLADFEGAKHTCASALATHNARRRRRKPDSPPSDAANGSGERDAAPGLTAVSAWLSEFAEHSSAPSASNRALMLMCLSSPDAAPAKTAAPDCATALAAAAAAAVQAAALHGCTLHIKLPSAAGPDDVPLAALRSTAADVLRAAVAPPTVAIRPGCVLLALDALLPAAAARALSAQDAAAAVAGRFEAAASVLWDGAAPSAGGSLRASPPPPRLRPAAVQAGAGEWASLRVDHAAGPRREGCTWHARLAGRALPLEQPGDDAAAGSLRLRLPLGSEEGAVLLEQQSPDGGVSRSRVVLLCADARVVAQVAAAAERAASDSAHADAATQAATRLLGDALRPGAPRRVRAAAAVAAARMGWDAALARLLHDAGDDAATLQALLLAAAPHAQQGPCRAALAMHAGGAWPAGACERAAAALQAATHYDAHLRPDCAVAAALAREANPAAAAVLAAVAQVLQDRDEDDDLDDEDDDAGGDDLKGKAMQPRGRVEEIASLAADAEEEERAYVAFLERRNGTHMRVISALALFGNAMCMLNMARYALLAPGPPADLSHMGTFAGAVASTHLHPLDGGPPLSPSDVPWPVFVAHLRVFFWASLLLRAPMQVAWVAAASRFGRATAPPPRPTPPTSYEAVFLGFLLADTVFYALAEALAMHAGYAVEWPTVNAVLSACGLAIGLRNGPFRARAVRIFCAAKLAATAVPLLYARAWRVLLLHASVAIQLAVLLLGLACASVRERALRKAAAAERSERAAAAKASK